MQRIIIESSCFIFYLIILHSINYFKQNFKCKFCCGKKSVQFILMKVERGTKLANKE